MFFSHQLLARKARTSQKCEEITNPSIRMVLPLTGFFMGGLVIVYERKVKLHALQAPPGKVLVPAATDQLQSLALSALQVLKVIEDDIQPGDLCTRREYARWLVLASSALSRNTTSKVYPVLYIEIFSELAFDDITPEDPDFPSIQGLAEAGLFASKLSRRDLQSYGNGDLSPIYFSPESPLSRQDLVSWKMALEKRQLPIVHGKILQQLSGFIDIDKIDPAAWPALVADLGAGDQGTITLASRYTRPLQPEKLVTKAQAAIALSTGDSSYEKEERLARRKAITIPGGVSKKRGRDNQGALDAMSMTKKSTITTSTATAAYKGAAAAGNGGDGDDPMKRKKFKGGHYIDHVDVDDEGEEEAPARKAEDIENYRDDEDVSYRKEKEDYRYYKDYQIEDTFGNIYEGYEEDEFEYSEDEWQFYEAQRGHDYDEEELAEREAYGWSLDNEDEDEDEDEVLLDINLVREIRRRRMQRIKKD